MRINRYLASCGVGSRRKMDKYIMAERVKINGEIASPGNDVNPSNDTVLVDNEPVKLEKEIVGYLLNKPLGYLTTMDDPQGRPCVNHFVKDIAQRVFPVGRLDKDSQGLLLFTNDGKLAHRLSHPRHDIEKRYRVTVDGMWNNSKKTQLETGVKLKEGTTSPAQVLDIFSLPSGAIFDIIIHEGWKRQIRRMCLKLNLYVKKLVRIQYGILKIDGYEEGKIVKLSLKDMHDLRKTVNLG